MTPAPWVPLKSESPVDTWSAPGMSEQTVLEYSVPVHQHRLHPGGGYHPEVVGNLQGVQSVPSPEVTRNHAMVVPIEVGTPRQWMNCLLDASNADLWLPSSECLDCGKDFAESSGFYHAEDSSTFSPVMSNNFFGPMPEGLRVIYGSGSVGGFVVNDTIQFGKSIVKNQTFVAVADGDPASARYRSWDGVCGIGWGVPHHGGQPLFEGLRRNKERATYQLMPPAGVDGGSMAAASRLFVGTTYGLPDRQAILRSSYDPAKASSESGSWDVPGSVAIWGGLADYDGPARIVFETGTSYLLVPPQRFIPFMRTLIPNGGFTKWCGLDKEAGNLVICNCAVRDSVSGHIVLRLRDIRGVPWDFPIESNDLFEVVKQPDGKPSICIPQVQQRSRHADVHSPGGVLGSPFEHHGFDFPMTNMSSFLPSLPGLGPLMGGLLGPGPAILDGKPSQNAGSDPLANLLPGIFGQPPPPPPAQSGADGKPPKMDLPIFPFDGPGMWPSIPFPKGMPRQGSQGKNPSAQDGATPNSDEMAKKGEQILEGLFGPHGVVQQFADQLIKEDIVEMLEDGTRCQTELVRFGNGSVVNLTTTATTKDGTRLKNSKVTCARTRHMGTMMTGGDARQQSRKLSSDTIETAQSQLRGSAVRQEVEDSSSNRSRQLMEDTSKEVWVAGYIFLKRYAVHFDFDGGFVGVTKPRPTSGKPDGNRATIEAFQPGAGEDAAIATFEASGPRSWSTASAGQAAPFPPPPLSAGAAPTRDEPVADPAEMGSLMGEAGVFLLLIFLSATCGILFSRSAGRPGAGVPTPCDRVNHRQQGAEALLEDDIPVIE